MQVTAFKPGCQFALLTPNTAGSAVAYEVASSGLGSSKSLTRTDNSCVASRNWRSVRTVGPKVSNSAKRQPILVVGAAEIRKFLQQLLYDVRIDWLLYPRSDTHIARIEANLPFVGRRNHDIAAYQLAPLHVVAECGGEQTDRGSRARDRFCKLS